MKREDFLAHIRRQLQSGSLAHEKSAYLPAAEQRAAPPPPVDYSNVTLDMLVEQFTEEVRTLSGEVYHANSETDVYEYILHIFTQNQANSFMAWDDKHLPIADLNTRLTVDGYTREEVHIPNCESIDNEERRTRLLALSDVKIGLTSAIAALSDTGSLVVECGVGRSRLASLLPPIHIAILKKKRLFPSMAHFIEAYPLAAIETSNLVFITGPSRTADIEQTLTLGVHGPKEVHVILI